MPVLQDSKLLKQFQKHKSISESGNATQHRRAKNNHAFHHGNEAAYKVVINERGRKKMVVFNKVKPFIDAVTGFMIQLRRKPEYQARMIDSASQQALSSYMNSISEWARKTANMDNIETRQDREMLISGYGAVDTNIGYENNPDGEAVAETVKYNHVFWDPEAMEPNLLDKRWVYRFKTFDKDEALQRWPDAHPQDFEEINDDTGRNFVFNPTGGQYDQIAEAGGGNGNENMVKVYYYQYWLLEKYYRAENPIYLINDANTVNVLSQLMAGMKETRMTMSSEEYIDDIFEFNPKAQYLIMTPTIKSDMESLFARFGIQLQSQEYLKRCYYTAVMTETKVLQKFKSPDQRGYTIKFKTGSYDPDRKIWYSMVDSLKEPAKYSNKALTEILYVIASNSKGGVMYEKSAVENPERFEQQYASTKAAIAVEDGAISGNKITSKAQASLPSGYEKIYEISINSLTEVSGINKEFIGTSINQQVSALLESQRINQVVSTLADYFDSIALYQIEHARLMSTYIRMLAQNSQGRLVCLIGPDGARGYMQLSEDKLADEYDVDIGEAPTSPTQKQETRLALFELANAAAAQGYNIWDIVVDWLSVKQSDKQKLKERLAPNPQAEQMKSKVALEQHQDERMLNQAISKKQEASAGKDMADKLYKLAQIPSIQIDDDETRANTVKLLHDADKSSEENKILRNSPVGNMNI